MGTPYLKPGAALPYCKGCSHALVLHALGEALERLALPPESLAVVTDIGCVGLADAQFQTPHTVHTTHGRSTAFAAGLALADSVLGARKLKTVVMIGDGGAMIGINHLVHAALLNPDVTVLLHNNFLFGMTGGQNSAFSPLDFITATTPLGNVVPPLDLARVLAASRAPFVARKLAGDRDLAEVIARAIAHPGFALVEVLELCTAYATRWNPLTGARLKELADRAGYELGVLRDEPRPSFAETYLGHAGGPAPGEALIESATFAAALEAPLGIVLAGSAGERVQTAAQVLAQAAMLAGLEVTLKNDYLVTQGTGFSLSEIILSPQPVLYTGIETPDFLLAVSPEGVQEMERGGAFARASEETLVLADSEVALPEVPGTVLRFPFRAAGPKLAALAAVTQWLDMTGALPLASLWAALELRLGATEAAKTRSALERFLAGGDAGTASGTPHHGVNS